MSILVIGSEGVIGSALCKQLELANYKVSKWDILISKNHDLTNYINNVGLIEEINNSDFIYFLAYDIGGSKYLSNMGMEFINRNLTIMINTFSNMKNKKFIFASSQMRNMNNVYGTLKLLGEQYTQLLNGISVRFWNVYGPEVIGEKSHVIPDFINKHITNNKIEMITDGNEERQFLHSVDCGKCLIKIMENYDTIKNEREIVDITNFEWIKIIDLAKMISQNVIIGKKNDTIQTLKNEPDDYILKFWNPEINLKRGIDMLINEYTHSNNP